MYLAWFDADKKKPTATKIAEGAARYEQKFGTPARYCILNPATAAALSPRELAASGSAVEPRALTTIAPNCFWFGVDDPENA